MNYLNPASSRAISFKSRKCPIRSTTSASQVAPFAGLGRMSSGFSINPHGEPLGQPCFIQVAGCHGEHRPDGLLCRNM